MPNPKQPRATGGQRRLGTETRDQFRSRLQKEGRWDEYNAERSRVMREQTCTSTAAHNLIYTRYLPGVQAQSADSGDRPMIEELFKDTLPNGCPLFDESLWRGRPTTNLLEDVQWVASHLGLRDFDYVNRAPSLRACTLYWEARYTLAGMQRYQALLQQLEIPDKATLKQLNSRRDDGEELSLLDSFIKNYEQHQSGQSA